MDSKRTIDILEKDKCSGCSACYNVCPKDAIRMEYNAEGFLEPVICEELCISCGLCQSICPSLHPYKENDFTPTVYVVKRSSRVAKESTSAGVFAALAEYVLGKNGYVCGAAYNENFEVCHEIVTDKAGVKKIKQSKYVQSEIKLVYRELKSLLDEGQLVLFSGTPCQVAGFMRYLRKPYDNLITMDILCHGVPAPLAFKQYLEENVDVKNLVNIEFRYKGKYGFRKHYICFTYQDGSKEIKNYLDSSYYYHFVKALALRKSCGQCEAAIRPRVGDFSAGDYWGAQVHHPEWINNDQGLSLLYLNNDKAREIFKKIKRKFSFVSEISCEEAKTNNRSRRYYESHLNRQRFFDMLNAGVPFNEAVSKNAGNRFDVALYGNTISADYGILMAYYSLYKVIYNLGYGVIVVPPPSEVASKGKKTHQNIFVEQHMLLADEKSLDDFKEYNLVADAFWLGPDQLWNYGLFDIYKGSMYLDFVEADKKKIAYGTSFGAMDTDAVKAHPEYENYYSRLRQIEKMGVASASPVKTCREALDVDAKEVLNSVFLLNDEEYISLANEIEYKQSQDQIAMYLMFPDDTSLGITKAVAEEMNLNPVYMGTGRASKLKEQEQAYNIPFCKNLDVREWLANILHSKYVITDTYYGVCFAVIFKKDFVVLPAKKGSAVVKALLRFLHLEERYLEDVKALKESVDVLRSPIDYEAVKAIIEKEKASAMNFIKDALSKEKC